MESSVDLYIDAILDYPFAKFNKVIDIIEYTDEDYEKYLTGKHLDIKSLLAVLDIKSKEECNRYRLE